MLKYPSTLTSPAKWAALEEYHVRISKLVKTYYPECLNILRARTRRVLMRAALEGRIPMDLPFDNEQPWNGVFTQVSRDMDFWAHEVLIFAQNFLAWNGPGNAWPRGYGHPSACQRGFGQ